MMPSRICYTCAHCELRKNPPKRSGRKGLGVAGRRSASWTYGQTRAKSTRGRRSDADGVPVVHLLSVPGMGGHAHVGHGAAGKVRTMREGADAPQVTRPASWCER